MIPLVDIDKTLESQKVVLNESRFVIILKSLMIIITAVSFCLSGMILIFWTIHNNEKTEETILFITIGLLSIFIGIIMLMNIITNSRFNVIRGLNKDLNRKLILDIITKRDDYETRITDDYIEIITGSIINYSKMILVVFNGKDILIKTIYNKNSPLHFWADKKLIKQIRLKIINAL